MNKAELIEHIANTAGLSKTVAAEAFEAALSGIARTLKEGKDVVITGFGTFKVKTRAARMGRNPKTGETIQIKASRVPSFKAGKGLKDDVA